MLDSVGNNITTDDVLFNLMMKDTQLIKDTSLLRGGGKKDPLFFQMPIESTMQVSDIIVDCIASIGK